ncbi:MAG: hypothetical protein IJT77_13405, partial [Clostridia bacterium]|nr:hypothetical protein [Clostridia bacterium]
MAKNNSQAQGLYTPYDSAFKSIVRKCPRMVLPLINELFFEKQFIEERFDGSEEIVLLDKELPGNESGKLEEDFRIQVTKYFQYCFHLECESSAGGTEIIPRIIRYDTRSAGEEVTTDEDGVFHVHCDDSGVILLRSTRNTQPTATVMLSFPQGIRFSYRIPMLRIQAYNLGTILSKKLYILLPFLFFNHESELKKAPRNSASARTVRTLYSRIVNKLKELADNGEMTAYEASTLYDALKIVFVALGATNKAGEEVKLIMGGKVLEFSADKYYNAGREEGRKEGR